MFRHFLAVAALSLAPFVSAGAQSPSHPAMQHGSTSCDTLHAMMLQHASAMGLDSAQLATIHAAVKDAAAHGASPDSLHHAILSMMMHDTNGHADQMMPMHLDSAQAAAMHACFDHHARDHTAQKPVNR